MKDEFPKTLPAYGIGYLQELVEQVHEMLPRDAFHAARLNLTLGLIMDNLSLQRDAVKQVVELMEARATTMDVDPGLALRLENLADVFGYRTVSLSDPVRHSGVS